MKFSLYRTIALCLVCVSSLHANQTVQTDPADLIKTCQHFKEAFLAACQMIAETQYTSEIKFLKEKSASTTNLEALFVFLMAPGFVILQNRVANEFP